MPVLGWWQSGRLRRDGDLVLIVRLGFELVGDERGRCRAIGDLDFGGQRESVCVKDYGRSQNAKSASSHTPFHFTARILQHLLW